MRRYVTAVNEINIPTYINLYSVVRVRPRFDVGLTFRVDLQHLLTFRPSQVRIFKIVIYYFRLIVIIPANHRDIRYYNLYLFIYFFYNRF